MSTRTNAQLNSDFPVDTYAHYVASSAKFAQLVLDGQLRTDEIQQVLEHFATYLDPAVETAAIAAVTLAFTGTAGATTRKYLAIPTYPVVDPTGVQPSIKSLPGAPPFGRPTPVGELIDLPDNRTRRYIGGTQANTALTAAVTQVANTSAALDANDYVTITTPNVGGLHIAGVLYDVVAVDGGGNYTLIASNVAPNTAVKDTGAGKGAFGKDLGAGLALYGAAYKVYAHTEAAYDATATKVVYAPNTTLVGE